MNAGCGRSENADCELYTPIMDDASGMEMNKGTDNTVVVEDPFARRLMVRYLTHRQDDVATLRTALAGKDFESIEKTGHNMFGSGSAYGLERISELGADLESKAKNGNGPAIGDLIDALDAFIRDVRIV